MVKHRKEICNLHKYDKQLLDYITKLKLSNDQLQSTVRELEKNVKELRDDKKSLLLDNRYMREDLDKMWSLLIQKEPGVEEIVKSLKVKSLLVDPGND